MPTGSTSRRLTPVPASPLDNPVICSPFDAPDQHFELGIDGPTGEILDGRRASEFFVPIPPTRKTGGRRTEAAAVDPQQATIDFDATGERRELNSLINEIRYEVDLWRDRGYAGVTPHTRKLLEHWAAAPPLRDDPVFFCQREAAETAIFLTEVAGRHGPDFRDRLEPENDTHNNGLPRVALKMATGTGKTVVMAMLIAWHTINKVNAPRDARFSKRFLVVTPGITIRDRLRVLMPSDPGNYYRERDLVPAELWGSLQQAQVVITNYHAFLPRDAKEIQGVAANTRKLLNAGKDVDPFKETDDQVVARVLRDLGGGKGEVVVFNDEAHHCYQDRPIERGDGSKADTDDKERNRNARVWFRGLEMVKRRTGIKTIYDLSATPFYLKGSGWNEGYIFPWVVSDFSLMDAIESGIVKVPRIPVDDDAKSSQVIYLNLWDHVGDQLPKKRGKQPDIALGDWTPPQQLEGALQSLYRSYSAAYERYTTELAALGEPPPVFIVVCPNTVVSKVVYDWISGGEIELTDEETRLKTGELPLLSNVEDGRWVRNQRTILIDSAQLESGEALKDDFKKVAAHEIEAFKDEFRRRNPGADADALTDADLLREVMNTVGKRGKLGEHVRCVVSVSMLTEGWDANTVTHILGVRPFKSQLLCEQVVGRGLRRRNYAVNEHGLFDPEYAEVYGIPFAFIPSSGSTGPIEPPPPAVLVEAIDARYDLRITFPRLSGYRVEMPDAELMADFDDQSTMVVGRDEIATWTQTSGLVGESATQELDDLAGRREQEVAFRIARRLVRRFSDDRDLLGRPWLFPQLVDITRRWLDSCVSYTDGATVGFFTLEEAAQQAAEKIFHSVQSVEGSRQEILRPILQPFDSRGSTDDVHFATRKVVIPTSKSHVSHVTLDGPKGNSWEEHVAGLLEQDGRVVSYVKNDHLGFAVPYVHKGRSHLYYPDFLARLNDDPDDPIVLIIEVSGGQKSPGPTDAKADTTRWTWCPAVNNHGGFGRWHYIEVENMMTAEQHISAAINTMLEIRDEVPV